MVIKTVMVIKSVVIKRVMDCITGNLPVFNRWIICISPWWPIRVSISIIVTEQIIFIFLKPNVKIIPNIYYKISGLMSLLTILSFATLRGWSTADNKSSHKSGTTSIRFDRWRSTYRKGIKTETLLNGVACEPWEWV